MSPAERRACAGLAAVFAARLLGLFMILPVFSLYASEYAGYTPVLAGLAIGIYGLTQAVFQIPFGRLSDRIGRKRVIVAGLVIFLAGSVLAALAETMWQVVLGRALQGSGAIAAAVMALTADLTREEQRTKAMAFIGVTIGLAFGLAMVIGPATARVAGLSGLFWLTAALALGAIVIVTTLVPDPPQQRLHRDTDAIPGDLLLLLRDRELLRLDAGIFILHAVMTASFVVLPLTLRDQAGLAADAHWWAYLVVLVAAIALMLPCVIHADRRDRQKPVFLGAIGVLVAAHVGLAGSPPALGWVLACMVAYFAAFNVLEASLPSLVSRLAPSRMKGTALGAYSTSQYLGAFTGGLAGGLIHAHLGMSAVYLFCAAIALGWLVLAAPMRNPRPFTSQLLRLGPLEPAEAADLHRRLTAVPGVAEAVVMPEEGVAYLKVDRRRLDQEALQVAVRP